MQFGSTMSDPPGSYPPPLPAPATGDRLAQLAIVLLAILIAATILVSLVFMFELGMSVLAEQAGRFLRSSSHLALRFMDYAQLFGAPAHARPPFSDHHRRPRGGAWRCH